MSEEQEDVEVLTLVDEDGNEEEFAVLQFVDLPEGRFAVLVPTEQMFGEEEPEEMDLYVFSYREDAEGNAQLDPVEDEALLDRIYDIVDAQYAGDEEDDESLGEED